MTVRGLRFAEGAQLAAVPLFAGELQARVGACIATLRSEAAGQELEELMERPDAVERVPELLRRAVPSLPEVVRDVQGALTDELAASAVDGTIPVLASWPITMPEFDTRTALVLWCRGFRPSEADVAAVSDRVGQVADQARWNEEVAQLTDAQREEYLAAQAAVERGEQDRGALSHLWEGYFPDGQATYLRHLGRVISEFLNEQRQPNNP